MQGQFMLIMSGYCQSKGKSEFKDRETGKIDISFGAVLQYRGGTRKIYFNNEAECNACTIQVGEEFDALCDVKDGKENKVYIGNVRKFPAGTFASALRATAVPELAPGVASARRAA